MAQDERKINFSAQDNGISSFMKRLQSDSKTLFNEMSKEAEKQAKSQREQIKLIEQQIKALERANKLEKEQNQLLLERKRAAGTVNEKSFNAQMSQIKEDSSVNKVQLNILKDLLQTLKEGQKKEENQPATGKQVFGAVITAGMIRDVMHMMQQVPGAKSQLDLLTPFTSMTGGVTGGVIGAMLMNGAAGAAIGKEVGQFTGAAITRSLQQRSDTLFAQNQLGALVGGRFGYGLNGSNSEYVTMAQGDNYTEKVVDAINNRHGVKNRFSRENRRMGFDMTMFGMDYVAATQMMENIARTSGRGGRGFLEGGAMNVAGLQQGFGIDQGTTMSMLALLRQGGSGGMTAIQKGLGVAIAEGFNRVGFTDVVKAQGTLTAQLASVTTNVNADQVNRTLFEFNRMGGMFNLMDPRAIQNINAIQGNLSNPGSAFGQALNYSVLRRLNPTSGFFDIRKMQEQGLNTPGFLQSVIGDITSMGGSEDFQKLMLKSRFSNLSFEAIDTLYNNRGKIGSMSQGELDKMLGSGSIRGEASQYATKLRNDQAEISNAFTDSFIKGIGTLKDKFVEELGAAVEYIGEELRNVLGGAGISRSDSSKVDEKGRYLMQSTVGSKMGSKPLPKGKVDSNYKVDPLVQALARD